MVCPARCRLFLLRCVPSEPDEMSAWLSAYQVYPIVGNAMANNMAAHFVPWCLDGNPGGERFTARERYLVKTGIRLMCAVPPIFLGAIAGNLSTIFGFAGLASFFLEFLFPALFQWYSVSTLKAQTAVSATTKDSESWLDGARTPYGARTFSRGSSSSASSWRSVVWQWRLHSCS